MLEAIVKLRDGQITWWERGGGVANEVHSLSLYFPLFFRRITLKVFLVSRTSGQEMGSVHKKSLIVLNVMEEKNILQSQEVMVEKEREREKEDEKWRKMKIHKGTKKFSPRKDEGKRDHDPFKFFLPFLGCLEHAYFLTCIDFLACPSSATCNLHFDHWLGSRIEEEKVSIKGRQENTKRNLLKMFFTPKSGINRKWRLVF